MRATATDARRPHQEVRFPWVPHGVSVLVFVHASCADCDGFVARVAECGNRFRNWGSTVWVVDGKVTSPAGGVRLGPVRELVDEKGELHAAADIAPGEAAVVVLDVHGEVYFSADGSDHDFPSTEALFEEARFPALQCPECDTPDVPSQSRLPD